ncbi:MAG: 3-deoxy-D-manno-octulosonic acid transferase [Burkholderiales bacterium]|nr:3-deoxy-D-manno-octulosonic acid transferase [Burkholderiales bacterium]
MRWLYSLLMVLAQPGLRRKLARRALAEPLYAEAVPERFGEYASAWPASPGPTVWVHAVSLGETRTAALLIVLLRQALPGMRLLLTHGTATGRAEGARLLQAGDAQVWLPWDSPGPVRRFVEQFRPDIGILMETEVWPNLVAACQHQGVPLVLANARLSERSFHKAQRLAWLAHPAYRALAAVWAQAPDDARRLQALGSPVQGVFGNLKFDAEPDASQVAAGREARVSLGRPVAMLASSRDEEEAQLLDILEENRPLGPVDNGVLAIESVANQLQWLIVPRHPQRFDAVAALVQARGFALVRRSQGGPWPPTEANVAGSGGSAAGQPPTIWLGDSLGEMAFYYGLADVALLGGSFEPLGGQNLIEAAACGCPVLMGPHTFNFAEAAELALAAGAAQRVGSMGEGVAAAQALLAHPAQQHTMAEAALSFAGAHAGAGQRTVVAVQALLLS